ncbi:MAG: DUF2191 domain-containing protein [Planctomycetes bacterium]|nr:DUF2191 domain-containing protein [Planctomycetota bacterium]
MVTHMKTTIDISDALLREAKRQARSENRTLKDLMEEALRKRLAGDAKGGPFRLRRHAMRGKGLRPGIPEGNWAAIRDLLYGTG